MIKGNNKYELIGSKIKEARESKKMSQLELAKLIGYESATAISLLESGARRISIEDLEKIAKILLKDLNYFLDYNNKNIDFEYALRADKKLSIDDKEEILNFIEYIKSKKKK